MKCYFMRLTSLDLAVHLWSAISYWFSRRLRIWDDLLFWLDLFLTLPLPLIHSCHLVLFVPILFCSLQMIWCSSTFRHERSQPLLRSGIILFYIYIYNNFPSLQSYWNKEVFDRSAPYFIISYEMIRSPYFLHTITCPVVCLPFWIVDNLPAQRHWNFRNLLNYVVPYRQPLPIEYWLFGWGITMLVLPKLSNGYGLRNVVQKSKAMRQTHRVLQPGSVQVKIMFTFCFVSSLDKFSELSFTGPHDVFKKIVVLCYPPKKHFFASYLFKKKPHYSISNLHYCYWQPILTRRNSYSGMKYCDEPAIFAWELMNEPRCLSISSGPHIQVAYYLKTPFAYKVAIWNH